MAFILVIILALFANSSEAQVETNFSFTTIWSYGDTSMGATKYALLYTPDEYADSTSKRYPLLLFCHGAGQTGSGASGLSNIYATSDGGIPYQIESGNWPDTGFINPKDGKRYKFFVVSVQNNTWSAYARMQYDAVKYMVANYRIDTNRIYMTGLSAGGESTVGYASAFDNETGGTLKKDRLPAAIVPMSPAGFTTAQLDNMITRTVQDSVRVWAFGSLTDTHGNNAKYYADGVTAATNSTFSRFTEYSGGHCCWAQFYIPTYKEKIGSDSMNIYSWMLQFSRGTDSVGMTANAGSDQSLSAGTTSTTLSGSGTPSTGHSITGYGWTQISGTSATIVSPTSASTSITGLTAGARTFRLTVTQSGGATQTDDVVVSVSSYPAPSVNVGSDKTVTTDNTTVTASATPGSGASISSYLWTKVSGTGGTIVNPANVSTTLSGLSNGVYVYRCLVTQSDGQTAQDDIQITVNIPAEPDTCGCDVTIGLSTPADTAVYWTNPGNVLQPGDTLCIRAGRYNQISLRNIKGTAANPIVIKNCGGLVNIASDTYGGFFVIKNSEYFKVTGTGSGDYEYGFKAQVMNKAPGVYGTIGYSVGNGTRYYSFDHCEAYRTSIGFFCKVFPDDFDSTSWKPYWNIGNVTMSHNNLRDTDGEMFYMGHNDTVDSVYTVNGSGDTIKIAVEPPLFDTVRIYDNIMDSSRWDGIQVSNGNPFIIHDNKITNFGLADGFGQRQGIVLGSRGYGDCYNNWIKDGKGNGISATVYGGYDSLQKTKIYNNVIVNTRETGIYLSDHKETGAYSSGNYYVFNNTVVNTGVYYNYPSIRLQNTYSSLRSITLKNNIITGYVYTPAIYVGNPVPLFDTSNNVVVADSSVIGFIGGGDYHINPTSPIYNRVGVNASAYFTDDYEHTDRHDDWGVGAYKTFSGSALPVIIRQYFIKKLGTKFKSN